jgi:hypothetical protein
MTTNRVPINRPAQAMVSPRAIELFVELERARRARKHADDCVVSEFGLCEAECAACERWWTAHNELHDELRLDPWLWPAVPRNPYPVGSPGAREWRPDADAKALWDRLKAAHRAATATRRTASLPLDEEDTNAEPIAGEGTLN